MFLPFDTNSGFQINVIGVSHWNTPLEIREQFSISNKNLEALYNEAKLLGFDNLMVVSTCNRTELYSFSTECHLLKSLLMCFAKNVSEDLFSEHVYHKKNHEAVRHLFRVCAGLDSQILGDFEILGQIKKSLLSAKQNALANGSLIRLVEQAIRSSKQIKQETEISIGSSSVASAAVQFLQKNVAGLQHKKALLIGTGKIGRVTCSNLTKQIPSENITVVNRTFERAEKIAQQYQLNVGNFENLHQHLSENEIIIVATGADYAVLTEKDFENISSNRKIIFDLSVPRNVDENIGNIDGVALVNVDQLEDLKNESLQMREQSVPRAKQIIHAHILEYYGWLHSTPVFPLLNALVKQAAYSDINRAVAHLNNAGVFLNISTDTTPDVVVKKCIVHLKENYHKPETERLMKEAFQLEVSVR